MLMEKLATMCVLCVLCTSTVVAVDRIAPLQSTSAENCSLLRNIDFETDITRIGFQGKGKINGWTLSGTEGGGSFVVFSGDGSGAFQLPPQGPPRGLESCRLSLKYLISCSTSSSICGTPLNIQQLSVITNDVIMERTSNITSTRIPTWRTLDVTLDSSRSFKVAINKVANVIGSLRQLAIDNITFSESCCPGWLACSANEWRVFPAQSNVTSWERAERECRRHGGHLGLYDRDPFPNTANSCYNRATTITTGNVLMGVQSYYDGRFRWIGGNNRVVADRTDTSITLPSCAAWVVGSSRLLPISCDLQTPLPYLCVRNEERDPYTLSFSNCDGRRYTYIPIAFSEADATQQCNSIGLALVDFGDQQSRDCTAKLLMDNVNGTQAGTLPFFTSSANNRGLCALRTTEEAAIGTATRMNCSHPHPAVCAQATLQTTPPTTTPVPSSSPASMPTEIATTIPSSTSNPSTTTSDISESASWTMCSTDSSLEMLLVQRNASWNDAERSCQGAFGHLATVRGNSDCVMEAIKSLVTCSQDKFCGVANHAIHVGLRRSNIPTAYRWVGSLNKEEDVTTSRMFIPGNNISLRQDCTRLLALSPNAQVWTAGCSALGQYYLCQRRRPLARYDSRLECNATGTTLTFNTISVLPAEARRLCDAQGGTLLEQSDRLSPTANCTRTLLQNTGQMNEALLTRIECPKQDGFCYARLASGELEQMRSNNVVDNALQFICEVSNPCLRGLHNCVDNMSCEFTPGESYQCTCPPGYQIVGSDCTAKEIITTETSEIPEPTVTAEVPGTTVASEVPGPTVAPGVPVASSSSDTLPVIAGAAGGGVLLLVAIVVIVVLKFKRGQREKGSHSTSRIYSNSSVSTDTSSAPVPGQDAQASTTFTNGALSSDNSYKPSEYLQPGAMMPRKPRDKSRYTKPPSNPVDPPQYMDIGERGDAPPLPPSRPASYLVPSALLDQEPPTYYVAPAGGDELYAEAVSPSEVGCAATTNSPPPLPPAYEVPDTAMPSNSYQSPSRPSGSLLSTDDSSEYTQLHGNVDAAAYEKPQPRSDAPEIDVRQERMYCELEVVEPPPKPKRRQRKPTDNKGS